MPRLFDGLLKFRPEYRRYELVVIDDIVDAAAEWMEANTIYDLPTVTPPFELTCLEWFVHDRDVEHIAAYIWRADPDACRPALKELNFKAYGDPDFLSAVDESAHVLFMQFFTLDRRGVIGDVPCRLLIPLDAHGTIKFVSGEAYDKRVFNGIVDGSAFPAFLFALSMMNTRNIEVVTVDAPPKVKKRREQSGREPFTQYKILRISPTAVQLRKTDDQPESPRDLPRHLVRGHFKDYRNGNGLFGRIKDLIWFPEQWRGNTKNGVVLKDYELYRSDASKGKA